MQMDDFRSMLEEGLTETQWIAVSSQKGGVGKTTTCLSLGASLVEQGLRVLLVDLDPQGNLTQALGIDPESLRRTVGDALLMQATMLEVSRETAIFNLDLVPANRGLILAEKMLHNTRNFELRLKTCLEAMQPSYYDIVLMDCPPSFGPLTINALATAGLALIPLTCDYYSLQSLQTFLKLMSVLRSRLNPELQYRLLVTLFDGRTRLSRLFLDQYRQKYNGLLFDTVIPLDVKLRESPMFGRPVNLYASGARGAQEYRALAGELLSCLEVTI
jgi:chromosome partitioning protein